MYDDQQDLYEMREPLQHPELRAAATENNKIQVPALDDDDLRLTQIDLAVAIA